MNTALELPRLDGSTTNAQAIAEKLESHGVVVVENLVSNEEMDQLAEDLKQAQGVFYGAEGSFAGAHTTRNAGKPMGESKVAQDLAEHSLIVDAVGLRLNKWCRRMVLGTCSAINVEPPPDPSVPPAPPQVLHRDEAMWGCTDWPWLPHDETRPEISISVMWAVSNFTADNGATRVIPGSHRWPRSNDLARGLDDLGAQGNAQKWSESSNAADLEALERQTVQAVMSKGSVMLWSGATLHGQSAQSPLDEPKDDCRIRRGIIYIYNVGWVRPEHNFHWAMPHSVLESFSPNLRELIGYVGTNRVEHPWYTGPVYAQPILYSAGATYGEEEQDETDGLMSLPLNNKEG